MPPVRLPAGPRWPAALLRWYRRNRRRLPWRERTSPYRVWVSEAMLQQTQVETVIPYFRRFLRRFPSWRSLAQSRLEDVLGVWEGLGYYARARHLHEAAVTVVTRLGGRIPRSAAGLRALPGVGAYTAAAISSICFGERVPVVDGNVVRVFARFWGIDRDSRSPAVRDEIGRRLLAVMPADAAGDFNQAMMELGALVCRPRSPACPGCPLRADCAARRDGLTDRLPVRPAGRRPPHRTLAAGVVVWRGRVLLRRRPPARLLGGLWEFPRGPREGREPLPLTVRREVRQHTGVDVDVGPCLAVLRHAYSHFRMTLHAFRCRPLGDRRPAAGLPAAWVAAGRLCDYPMSKVDRDLARLLTGAGSSA